MKKLMRDDTEHGKEYYLASEVDALLSKQEQGETVAFDVWLQECESMTMAVRHGVKFLLMPEESAVRIGTAIQNTTPQQRTWVGLMRGVRVEGDTVVISTKDNNVARDLCGALIEEKNNG
jgi:hypothetical protein